MAIKRHQEQFIGEVRLLIDELIREDLADISHNPIYGDNFWGAIIEKTTRLYIYDYGNKEDNYYNRIICFIETERPEIVFSFLCRVVYNAPDIKKERRRHHKGTLQRLIEFAYSRSIMYRKMGSDVQFMDICDIKSISDALNDTYERYYDILIKEDTMDFGDDMIYIKIIASVVRDSYEFKTSKKSLSEVLETLNYISEEYVIQLVEYLYMLEYRRNRDIKSTLEEILKPYEYVINDDNKIVKGSYRASIQAPKSVSLEDVLIITDSEVCYIHPHFGKKTYSLERKAGGRNGISKSNQILLMLAIDKHLDIHITDKDLINASDAISKQLGIPSDLIREYLRKKADSKSIIIYKDT